MVVTNTTKKINARTKEIYHIYKEETTIIYIVEQSKSKLNKTCT